jgi:hypothetical protein
VLGGDEVAFAAFSFLFNFRVVQVDRWGAGRKHLQNDFLGADYVLAKPKLDSYLGSYYSRRNLYGGNPCFPFWN